MAKIVYNACFGGFSLSPVAIDRYAELKGITIYDGCYLCPKEEYERIADEEDKNPIGPDRYAKSNALYFCHSNIDRADPFLVQVVEELGDKANGSYAKLRIKEVPTGTLYRIDDYDGYETVETVDSIDWKVA